MWFSPRSFQHRLVTSPQWFRSSSSYIGYVPWHISKAFYPAWRYKILHAHSCNTDSRLLCCVTNFFRNRTFKVRIQSSVSIPANSDKGVFQDAGLSPILFSVINNEVLPAMWPLVSIALITDDLALLPPGDFPASSHHVLQQSISTLFHWSVQNGFTVSAIKSIIVYLCRLYSYQRQFHFFWAIQPTHQSTLWYLDMVLNKTPLKRAHRSTETLLHSKNKLPAQTCLKLSDTTFKDFASFNFQFS